MVSPLEQRSLVERQAERDAWRERATQSLQGLGRAVSQQFRDWELTPAEREVAVLLLKGQSHKEIATATGRSERTVRQHAIAAYHKAGVGGAPSWQPSVSATSRCLQT